MNQNYRFAPPPRQSSSSTASSIAIIAVCMVPVIGILSIYGARRNIAFARTAEAKSTVDAIARGAAAAYEREEIYEREDLPADQKHVLCESTGHHARGHGPVPSTVPLGKKYQPDSTPGTDFDTGTSRGGWRCLRFSITKPTYYQYNYNKGSGYLYPSSSLDLNGFEAAARGDVDGDGVLSFFMRTGKVGASLNLTLSTQIYIEEQFE